VKPAETHPTDERLTGRYFDASGRDEALELHLLRCAVCAARAAQLGAVLDGDHDRSLGAADAAFGPDRMAAQRAVILARIAQPPGVLTFRGRSLAAPAAARVVRTSRWAAAAAVLAFSVSLGSGTWFGCWQNPAGDRFTDAPLQASLATLPEREDTLLLEIDRALARPQTNELRALEALTPRADEPVEF
jgi:hypothetical protein